MSGVEVLPCPDFLRPSGGPLSFERDTDVSVRVSFSSTCVLRQLEWVLRWWLELGSCEHRHGDGGMSPALIG